MKDCKPVITERSGASSSKLRSRVGAGGELRCQSAEKANRIEKRDKEPREARSRRRSPAELAGIVLNHSILSVAIYIIMIEGLGKGVKYSLFVANAIIFVSIIILLLRCSISVINQLIRYQRYEY